ncbi:hypothetical protein QF022_003703 [Vogesella perlucida]|nr:hypothetical protein [Vogesella perlucida]
MTDSNFPPEFSLPPVLLDILSLDRPCSILPSESAMQHLLAIKSALGEFGFAVIRRGQGDIPVYRLLESLGTNLFVDDYGRSEIILRANPFENTNAETLYEGKFHTDFSTLENPPDLIVLECIQPDARYPLYGRNQVVNLAFLLRKLAAIDKSLAQLFSVTFFPFSMRRGLFWSRPVHYDSSIGTYIKYHPGYLSLAHLDERHEIFGMPLHQLVEEVALDTAYDLCLGKGDILIVSNKKCLHRRGRATACFGSGINSSSGRIVRTTRYRIAHDAFRA